jgi:hypothetical protein
MRWLRDVGVYATFGVVSGVIHKAHAKSAHAKVVFALPVAKIVPTNFSKI